MLRGDWNGCCWESTELGSGNNIEAVDTRRSALSTDIGDQTFFPVGVIDDLAHNEVTLPLITALNQSALTSRLAVIAFQ